VSAVMPPAGPSPKPTVRGKKQRPVTSGQSPPLRRAREVAECSPPTTRSRGDPSDEAGIPGCWSATRRETWSSLRHDDSRWTVDDLIPLTAPSSGEPAGRWWSRPSFRPYQASPTDAGHAAVRFMKERRARNAIRSRAASGSRPRRVPLVAAGIRDGPPRAQRRSRCTPSAGSGWQARGGGGEEEAACCTTQPLEAAGAFSVVIEGVPRRSPRKDHRVACTSDDRHRGRPWRDAPGPRLARTWPGLSARSPKFAKRYATRGVLRTRRVGVRGGSSRAQPSVEEYSTSRALKSRQRHEQFPNGWRVARRSRNPHPFRAESPRAAPERPDRGWPRRPPRRPGGRRAVTADLCCWLSGTKRSRGRHGRPFRAGSKGRNRDGDYPPPAQADAGGGGVAAVTGRRDLTSAPGQAARVGRSPTMTWSRGTGRCQGTMRCCATAARVEFETSARRRPS